MSLFQSIIIAVIQGITEFLPISSTGHMIIAEQILGLQQTIELSDFARLFAINIHFGTILAVIIIYWKRFFVSIKLYYKLLFAFIPAAVIGLLADDFIGEYLGSVLVVSIALILGGVVLVFIDKWCNNTDETKELSYKSSFIVGLFQVISMIPGVSRSGATIVGGLTQKISRVKATEFSFLLAVPTILAASGYKTLKTVLKGNSHLLTDNISIFVIGNIVAFVVAIIAIKAFIGYIQKYGFKVFGYYRIVLGILLLTLIALGYNLNVGID